MPKQTEMMALVHRLKDIYLTSSDASGGGGATDYYKSVDAWADANALEAKRYFRQGLRKAAQIAWHNKAKNHISEVDEDDDIDEAADQAVQYRIAGFDLPREIVYYAPDGGKTKDEKYLHVYVDNGATVGHLEMDVQIFNDNFERQRQKKKEKDKRLKVALQRAGGDRSVLLKDIIDEDAQAA